jgi:hypothetical protein
VTYFLEVVVRGMPIIQGFDLKPSTFRRSFVVFSCEKRDPHLRRLGCRRCKIVLSNF